MNYGGEIYALNATTGAFVWSYSTGGSASWSSPTVADGRVYVGSGNGKVYAFGPTLYFNITVDPRFYDNRGEPLVPSPSSWTILFSNGTKKTASSTETYYGPMGAYSIESVVWKELRLSPLHPTAQHPGIRLASFFLDSNTTWTPRINCTLPTSPSLSLSSSTSFIGFQVGIDGSLTCNEVGVSDAGMLLSYSVTSGESWNDITFVNTFSDGSYSAVWMPSATGNYLVRAIWEGNSTYPGSSTIVSFAVTSSEGKNVFAVESNSTISALAFNSTSLELSFSASGHMGTKGYVKVTIAKSLISNIADVKAYLNGTQIDYTATSLDDSWQIHLMCPHSTHAVVISLGGTAEFEIPRVQDLILIILGFVVVLAVIYLVLKRKRLRVQP